MEILYKFQIYNSQTVVVFCPFVLVVIPTRVVILWYIYVVWRSNYNKVLEYNTWWLTLYGIYAYMYRSCLPLKLWIPSSEFSLGQDSYNYYYNKWHIDNFLYIYLYS